MTSEYTPTEDEIRSLYVMGRVTLETTAQVLVDSPAEFDRFIARIKAEAWEEGYEAAARYHDLDTEFAAPNPYREGAGL